MKFFFLILLYLLTFEFLLSQEQRLTLAQVLDSAQLKHPAFRVAQLKVEAVASIQKTYLDFYPTHFNYAQGKIFGNRTDSRFEINQFLGSPFLMASQKKMLSSSLKTVQNEQQLSVFLALANVKKAYYACLYSLELSKLYVEEYQVFNAGVNFYILNDSSVEGSIDKLMLETSLLEAEKFANTAYNDLIQAQNNLAQAAFLDIETMPADTVFEIYEIAPVSSSETRTPASLYNNIYKSKTESARNQWSLSKAAFLPRFCVNYTNQSIMGQSGFQYWSLGISLPLFPFVESSKKQKSLLDLKIAELEWEVQRSQFDATTANLLTEMNKLFETINFYYDFGLKQSSTLLHAAKEQMERGSIDVPKFIWAVQKSYSLRRQYLQTIHEYNQKAIELEVYAY